MNLEIIKTMGEVGIATVYMAKTVQGKYIEFAESLHSLSEINDKWVLIVSTLFGCPVACLICDAGSSYSGKLTKEEIFEQIDHLVNLRYPEGSIDCKEFKIQFARMGEPTLNPAVLEALQELPERYRCDVLLPSFSTIAPKGCDDFMAELTAIKNNLYANGRFQMQFSVHTTDNILRDKLIPIDKWSFAKIADYGEKFYRPSDKKIGLNFALAKDSPISVEKLKKYFSPELFVIKVTPVNPTVSSAQNNIESYFTTGALIEDNDGLVPRLKDAGYDVIVSIGNLEENKIGSNCGQFVRKYATEKPTNLKQGAYSYLK